MNLSVGERCSPAASLCHADSLVLAGSICVNDCPATVVEAQRRYTRIIH